MAFRVSSVEATNYYDSNKTTLVKAGTNTTVTSNPSGSYTIDASGSGKFVVGFITTTNSSSVVTVDISSYGFTSIPVVSLTTFNTSTTQTINANFSAISTTSISIRTFITQDTSIIIGGTVHPVVLAPNVTVHVILCQQ